MPGLLLPAAPLERALARRDRPAFAAAMAALEGEAAKALASPLRPLDRTAGYYHDYFCPEHAAELLFNEDAPHAHACPVDGKVWSGPPFDDAWGWTANRRMAQWVYRLALLWRLRGRRAHLDKARQYLTAYAARYPGLTSPRVGAQSVGKVTYHALDESVWAIPITWACHWLWDDLDAATQAVLRRDLLEPAARHIASQRIFRIHNYENWLNAAVATLGEALGDDAMVRRVAVEPFGFQDQAERGVMADGHWYELAPSYHFFTLGAVLALAQAFEGSALDQRASPAFRAMFAAALRIAYPDYFIPATNDCWYHCNLLQEVGHGIPSGPAFYEVAAGWFPSPEFNGVLTLAYRARPRDAVEALLYGPNSIPVTEPPALPETNEAASGYAVVRPELPAGEPGYVMLKYGPHGGGHGHADKLSLSVYGGGTRWSGDLGTPGYGIPINDSWYRHTLSHTTVLLDGEAQPPATGELLRHRPVEGNAFGIIDAQVAWEQGPYAAAYARRVVLARRGYFLVLTSLEAPVERRMHTVFHHAGHVSAPPAARPLTPHLPESVSYGHLRDPQGFALDAGAIFGIAAPCSTGVHPLTLGIAPVAQGALVLATSPGNPASDLRVALIIDTVATQSWTAVAFVYAQDARIQWRVEAAAGRPTGVTIQASGGTDRWTFVSGEDGPFAYPLG
ncbi:MAG: heparinase II/III family protein [Actinobacteria bacterium]|nr:heparinase II/III family protein [Actinomycetota bacterium]